MPLRLVWGITGSGDILPETFGAMSAVKDAQDVEITAVLSRAGVKVDQAEGTTITTLPGGEKLELRIRSVDIDNSRKLASMDGITTLSSPQEIAGVLEGCARQLAKGR